MFRPVHADHPSVDRFGVRTKMLLLALPAFAGAVACAPASAASARTAVSSAAAVEWSGMAGPLILDDFGGASSSEDNAQSNSGSDHKTGAGQPAPGAQTPSTSGGSSDSSQSSPSEASSSPSDAGSPGAEPDDIPSDGKDLLTVPGAPVPALGREVAVAPASGTVLVQAGGRGRFTLLQSAADLPVVSVVDASK